jgi:hypothetical protein
VNGPTCAYETVEEVQQDRPIRLEKSSCAPVPEEQHTYGRDQQNLEDKPVSWAAIKLGIGSDRPSYTEPN